jgi:serine phosphatase RsbU (regulator of sigma subunit)
MRILGERSLVSFLKLLIDIAYYAVFGATVLLIVIGIVIVALRPANVSLGLPARFDLDPSVYRISPTEGDELEVSIEKAQGQVKVTGVDIGRIVQGFAAGVLLLAVTVFVLRQFRGIFLTLKAGQPFVQANVKRIRLLGLAIMLGEVLRAAATSWSSSKLGHSFTSEGIQFRADFEPSMMVIFTGALLLVLAEVFREAASMKRDLETAREIQFDLVPSEEFRKDGISVRSRMLPANTVGGDYYDVIPLDGSRVAVVQADVAGKGIPAALLMAVLQGSLRTLVSAGFRGARLVGALNNYLNDNTPANRMVTLFYGELDTATGELAYVNAGHNRPFHIRHDGSLDRPASSSMVLGILADNVYEEGTLRLAPGERLLLFTDGVSEACDERDAEYGDERLGRFLQRQGDAPEQTLVQGLVQDVLGFCKPARPRDDMTLMLISRASEG